MTAHKPGSSRSLRQRAEDTLTAGAAATPKALSLAAANQLLHELRVHQIELEMQTEELRRAQEELETSRARYFDLYDLAPVGYCIVGEPWLILEANLTLANLLGVTRGALVKTPLSRFILKEDQTLYYRLRNLLFETGQPQACELRLVAANGALFWAQLKCTLAFTAEAAPVCRLILTDVTERKRAQEMLRVSESRFRHLFAANVMPIAFWNTAGALTDANASWCTLLGLDPGQVRAGNVNWTTLTPPELRPRDSAAIQEIQATGVCVPYEKDFIRPDGSRVTVLISGSMLADSTTEGLAFVLDLTERKRADAAVARRAAEAHRLAQRLLEVREEERRSLAAVLHHEVGSAAVGLNARLQAADAALRRHHTGDAQEALTQTGEMLDRWLRRLKSLALELRPPDLDLLGLPAALRSYFRQATLHTALRVEFRCRCHAPQLSPAQATTLFRVAQESLTNALRHASASLVRVNLSGSRQGVRLSLTDNGVGFDPGGQEVLAGTSHMGLCVMREMVTAGGGTFAIESTPGQGTQVMALMPVSEGQA